MTSEVSYIVMSPADFEQLKSAIQQPDMISLRLACKMFDISKPTLDKLADTGMITRYMIPGFPRSTRFKVSELQSIFKPVS